MGQVLCKSLGLLLLGPTSGELPTQETVQVVLTSLFLDTMEALVHV